MHYKESKVVNDIFYYVYCLFYDFWNLNPSRLDDKRKKIKEKEDKLYKKYSYYVAKNYFTKNMNDKNLFLAGDIIWATHMSKKYKLKKYKTNLFRSYFRALSSKKGFYFNFRNLKNNYNLNAMLYSTFLSGFNYLWLGIRLWVFPLIVFFSITYTTLVLRAVPFNKVMLSWIAILMFVYWLVSGFVFFFKKYQYGKYTTAIQRFWRRSYILFWLVEAATFSVFFFYTINSSQESFYMFDQISVFKTHLYSWRLFLLKIFPIVILILSTYLLMLSIKWNIYSKNSVVLLFITLFLTYIVWLEFYQFFHIINFYGNLNWIYDIDEHTWSLELEPRRTRMVNHYVNMLFILKFWHIIFIYGFWVFFALRCWETKRIRYPLLAANFQNFIILYIFAWIFMYPWFKFFFRKILDSPYYWFYVNNRRLAWRILFNDWKLFFYSFTSFYRSFELLFLKKFNYTSFYYWNILNSQNNFESYRKHVIKDRIIISLNNIK